MAEGRKKREAVDIGWMPYGGGYEVTRAPKLIAAKLADLLASKYPMIINYEGYQSGGRILQEIVAGHLVIDRPDDWSGRGKKIRVVFMDRLGLWNHFYVLVRKVTKTSLIVSVPVEYYLLQRRNNFRVPVPLGSLASFFSRNGVLRDLLIGNVSAGGMLVAVPDRDMLDLQEPLANISLEMVRDADVPDSQSVSLSIAQGLVVRAAGPYMLKYFGYGVRFSLSTKEEDSLVRYVRQRELELLRKSSV